jgi:hypothetical protein
MNSGKTFLGAVLVLIALATVSMACALPVQIQQVKLDGDSLDASSTNLVRAIDRNTEYEVKVTVVATDDVDDAQVEVYLRGYDAADAVQDISDAFDMQANRTYVKKFNLKFPSRLDKDQYKLRVRVEDRDGDATTENYEIAIEAVRHDMNIKDVIFSPSDAVIAGRSLLTTVRVQNVGMTDPEESVKVSVTVPELGIMAADYIDEIDEDDSVTSEELYLRIPSCVKGGSYDAIVGIEFDDGDKTATVTKKITVIEDETCKAAGAETPAVQTPKTIITVGPSTQDVTQGQGGVIYPLTISNAGSEAKTYVITADGYADWADISVSPSNIIVLQPGEAKAIYAFISAKQAAPVGEHMFSLKVSSGSETLKEFALKANVVAGKEDQPMSADKWTSVKRVLEIGLVVLVVLLVILGLIIGFSRLKGSDRDEEEGKSETYY